MVWLTLDDKWHSHPKVVGLSLSACGLWSRCGSWCSDHLMDGYVPRSLVRSYGASDEVVQELVDAGLWDEHDGGWMFHDWLVYNPSREKVLAKRKAEADRKAKHRTSKPRRKQSSERNVNVRAESERTPEGLPPESASPSPSPSPNPEERERARSESVSEERVETGSSEPDLAWVRLGKLYKELYDEEQKSCRNPRNYDENRILSTDSKQFVRLVELVRAESERSHMGQREVFRVACTSFLRDSTQIKKGLVLEFFVRDFEKHCDRALEAS